MERIRAGTNATIVVDIFTDDVSPVLYNPSGGVTLTLTNPSGTVVVNDQAMTNLSTGRYRYRYQSATDGVLGAYVASVKTVDATRGTVLEPQFVAFVLVNAAGIVTTPGDVVDIGDADTLLGATWAAPLAIGSTTPAPGTFTTLRGDTYVAGPILDKGGAVVHADHPDFGGITMNSQGAAVANGTAIRAAVAYADSLDNGCAEVVLPPGVIYISPATATQYLAAITLDARVSLRGSGLAGTQLWFLPTADNQELIRVKTNNVAVRDLMISSTNTTLTKIAIRLSFYDQDVVESGLTIESVDECVLSGITIGINGNNWWGDGSIGIQSFQTVHMWLENFRIYAARPLVFRGNTGSDLASVKKGALLSVSDSTGTGSGNTNPVVEVDAGSCVGFGSFADLSIAGGSAGFKGAFSASSWKEVRYEQAGASTNWGWDLDLNGTAALSVLLFNRFSNCWYPTSRGFKLRNCREVTFNGIFGEAGGAGTAIDGDDAVTDNLVAVNMLVSHSFTMPAALILVYDGGTALRIWRRTTMPTIKSDTTALRDTSAAFDVILKGTSSSALTADRILTLDLVNAARTLKISGNATVNQDTSTTGTPTHAAVRINGTIAGNATSALSIQQSTAAISQLTAFGPDGTTRGQIYLTTVENDGGNQYNGIILTADANVQIGTPLVALGGTGGTALGNIGGSGPATAAQNSWLQLKDSTGTAFWVPVWK